MQIGIRRKHATSTGMSRFKTGRTAQQRAELAAAEKRRQKRNTWLAIGGLIVLFAIMTVANIVMEINRRQAPDDRSTKDATNEVQSDSARRD